MSAPTWTLNAGRLLEKDGRPICTLHGARTGYDPVYLDNLARRIVELLNVVPMAQDALERVGCQFWACEGPDAPFEDMKTCARCGTLQALKEVEP